MKHPVANGLDGILKIRLNTFKDTRGPKHSLSAKERCLNVDPPNEAFLNRDNFNGAYLFPSSPAIDACAA